MIAYARATDRNLIGKNSHRLATTKWENVETDIESLAKWMYIDGRTFSAGVFDMETPLEADESTYRRSSRWLGAQVVCIDIDDADGWTLETLKECDVIKRAFFVFPSSSYTAQAPRWHVLFKLSQVVSDKAQYKSLGAWLVDQFPMPVDNSTINIAQAIYGTRFTAPELQNHAYAFDDGLCLTNFNALPLDVPSILAEQIAKGALALGAERKHTALDTDNLSLSKRVEEHMKAPYERRKAVTLDALRFALRGWGNERRDGRMALIMSAFSACDDPEVRDMFLEHSAPIWDMSEQKNSFIGWWANHTVREGYTPLTLFYLARQQGWLQESSVELQNAKLIETDNIGEWLIKNEGLPKHILLKSATGTGKTQGSIQFLKHLGTPKSIFCAPSIKLCMALSASLTQAGVENTLYIGTDNRTKDADTLKNANVLVTTLQTFAIKIVARGFDVGQYKFVVMDESDELFASFIKAGAGNKITMASHVTREQSQYGIEALYKIFSSVERVLLLDGTATELSRFLFTEFSNQRVGVYENTYKRPKAKVKIYHDLNTLRYKITEAVAMDKRVVIATDTKSEAELMDTLLKVSVLEDDQHDTVIRITGDTVSDNRVSEFFKDVEVGAQQYKTVIYNTAMGSGVSITQTTPDHLFLIASYLSPRKLLQVLNRYRSQSNVHIYISPRESIYSATVDERYEQLKKAIRHEATSVGLDMLEREYIADVITQSALILAQDEYDQNRSVKDFFARMLIEDGREIEFVEDTIDIIEDMLKEAKEFLALRKDEVKAGWRGVTPLKRGEILPKDITPIEVAKGVLHGLIEREFGDRINMTELTDTEIANLALRFAPHRKMIERWVHPEKIGFNTFDEMQNSRKEITTFKMYVTKLELVALVGELFDNILERYTDAELEERAKTFVNEIKARRYAYNILASNYNSYETVVARGKGDVENARTFAKQILGTVGLSVKRTNGKRTGDGGRERQSYIDGYKELTEYLRLKGELDAVKDVQDFNRANFKRFHEELRDTSIYYMALSEEERKDVRERLAVIKGNEVGDVIRLHESMSFALA